MKLQIQVLSLAVLSALPLLASAQDEATALDQVLVTATRTPIALQDSIAPAQVIDRAQIESSQATSLQELLRVASDGRRQWQMGTPRVPPAGLAALISRRLVRSSSMRSWPERKRRP